MGLLTRAKDLATETEQGTEIALDQMAMILCERINRLPLEKNTPYTALSLLKAYGSFQSAACLALKNDTYFSYTSVGMGITKLSILQKEIWSDEKASKKFFKYETGWEALLKDCDDGFDYWIFPLDNEKPWRAVVFLGVLHSVNFHPDSMSAVISRIFEKLLII